MENPDLIPVIVLRVDTACCKDCPRNLRKALLKMDGVCEVDFDSEYKNIWIRSTLDPLMITKEIAKMGKSAELIFYDKEPMLEDHHPKNAKTSRDKHPRTDEPMPNARPNDKEKTRCYPDCHDPRQMEDGHESDYNSKKNVGGHGKRSSCCCPDPHKKEDNHEADNRYYTRNVRESGQEKYYRCRNYASPENVRENGPEKHYRCRNYYPPHEPSEDNKIPKMFFEDADIFKGYSRRRTAFWDQYMPSRDDDPMFWKYKGHDHFRSKSCRYDARNSHHWYSPEAAPYETCCTTMPSSYEHHRSSMPPPYEQYGWSMPPPPPPPLTSPCYPDCSMENPNGCIIM